MWLGCVFAWYTNASNIAKNVSAADSASIATAASTIALGNLVFTPTIYTTADADLSSITGVQLSDASGNMGVYSGKSVTKAADENCYYVFKLIVTAAPDATASDNGYSVQTAKKSLIDGGISTVTVTVTPKGNVLVKKVADVTPTNEELTTTSTGLYKHNLGAADSSFVITLADDAVASWSAYFAVAVRTNNPSGKEYVKTGDALQTKGQVLNDLVAARAAEPAEDIGYDSVTVDADSEKTYEIKQWNTDKWESLGTKVYLHDANKVKVTLA